MKRPPTSLFADASVNVGCAWHIVGDVGMDIQRGSYRHVPQHDGEDFDIYAVPQCQCCEGVTQSVEPCMLALGVFQDEL